MIHIATKTADSMVEPARLLHGIYRHACPNCGGPISDLRLLFKAPCEQCLPDEVFQKIIREYDVRSLPRLKLLSLYAKHVEKTGRIHELIRDEKKLRDFEEFFHEATKGYSLWSAQRTWAKRIFRGESFSIIAPTGTGKTVFSLIMSLYRIQEIRKNGRKIYLVFPTTPLLLQAYNKLLNFASNLNLKICGEENWSENCLRIICFHGKLRGKEKKFYLEKVKTGDFDILITTNAFLHRHEEILPKGVYDLIVMDDVDAVLRSGRAVRRVLRLIGLSDDDVERGLSLVKLRSRLASLPREEAMKLELQVKELEEYIKKAREKIQGTKLVVNSATGRPRGIYPKLFRIFLNFEAGAKPEAIRNIVDTYEIPEKDIIERAVELAKTLRDGLLVFVPIDKGIEYAEEVARRLREAGLRAEAFHTRKQVDLIERFARGEINVLVGVASYYGVLVRGLDLPERVKYVMFIGIPRHKFNARLRDTIPRPLEILRLLSLVYDALEGKEKENVLKLIGKLSRRLRLMSQGAINALYEKFIEFEHQIQTGRIQESEDPLLNILHDAYKTLLDNLSKTEILEKLKTRGDIGLISENDELYILIPDFATYIQASGRCSRLYPGGITKGLSIILVDDIRLLNGLIKRMQWIHESFKPIELKSLNLEELMKEIEQEREIVKAILEGKLQAEKKLELVKTALLIVESPNKARTIANFFGKPSVRIIGDNVRVYEVTIGNLILNIAASGGHIYELIVDSANKGQENEELYGVLIRRESQSQKYIPVYTDIKTCPNGHQFTHEEACPKCGASISEARRKLSVVDTLRKVASEVDIVLIGTDPDSEGEKIAWDLRCLLEPYVDKIQRIEFHEVTRRAILNALSNPRDFDTRLVEAQIVRRIEDRWLGFALSEIVQEHAWRIYCLEYLSKKRIHEIGEKGVYDLCCKPNRNLSAGRVQTPVLGFIIEENNKARDPRFAWYYADIELEGGYHLTIQLSYDEAIKVFKNLENKKQIVLPNVTVYIEDKYEEEVSPPPPFTTDMLLAEASRVLGFSTTKTMELAQDLFEMGLITYHRTDSTRVSDTGIEVARQYLEAKYGADKLKEIFKPRSWGVGGAHEAIRPTRPIDADTLYELVREGAILIVGRFTRDHYRLYDLIFRRFIASQMPAAKVIKVKLKIVFTDEALQQPVEYRAEYVAKILERNYLEIYENLREEAPWALQVEKSITGFIKEIPRKVKYPLPRFHDIVKWMKENGIGRPSTYAKIIQTLIDRRYVKPTNIRKALLVVERGRYIFKFLSELFSDLISVKTTRELEEMMDRVESGQVDYQEVLSMIYSEVRDKIFSRREEITRYTKSILHEISMKELKLASIIDKCIEGM